MKFAETVFKPCFTEEHVEGVLPSWSEYKTDERGVPCLSRGAHLLVEPQAASKNHFEICKMFPLVSSHTNNFNPLDYVGFFSFCVICVVLAVYWMYTRILLFEIIWQWVGLKYSILKT